ncbi:MAG TPA: UpxY family transcription antiterminator [Methylomirabilota bacterium]|nr:UpxY family transcription antiterminator [Methylomirabilota bacterium]
MGVAPWTQPTLKVLPQPASWYAIRTRSRHEKLVREQLLARPGVDVFLPLWARWSRWQDRKKRVEFPLFPGYCFARLQYGDRLLVLKAVGVVDLLGMNGHAEPIPDDEISAVRRLIDSSLPYDPHPYLTEGMAVEVVRGPMSGVRGCLVRKEKCARLVIAVNLIRQSASVEIDAADVAPV